jgi:hypothetical protein
VHVDPATHPGAGHHPALSHARRAYLGGNVAT